MTAVGVDGCGAPLMAISVAGLARAFRSVVLAEPGTAERAVADAMRAYPEWTSGTTRPERALMAAVPGLLLKSGADGVEGFALADGRSAAFKIEDGAARGRVPITVALLRRLGAEELPGADLTVLARAGHESDLRWRPGGRRDQDGDAAARLGALPGKGARRPGPAPGPWLPGAGLGGGDVTELGRLTRQPWLGPVAGNASASPSAMY